MDVVILFCLVEGMGYTSYRLELSLVILLRENSPCSELGRIHFQEKGLFIVRSL